MEDTAIAVIAIVGFCISFLVMCCKAVYNNKEAGDRVRRAQRRRQRRDQTNQQEDIFNISSRVQGQGQGQGQWPTHDTHVSLDHFTITNEINKYNDNPPTYEEAMNLAAYNNNNVTPAVVPSAPKTTVTPTSTSSANQ